MVWMGLLEGHEVVLSHFVKAVMDIAWSFGGNEGLSYQYLILACSRTKAFRCFGFVVGGAVSRAALWQWLHQEKG